MKNEILKIVDQQFINGLTMTLLWEGKTAIRKTLRENNIKDKSIQDAFIEIASDELEKLHKILSKVK
jgi:hypothetical protein